jgi:FkbM family methyltransferase
MKHDWKKLRSLIAGRRDNLAFRSIAVACRKYLRAYENQFNWDIFSNGERFILEAVMEKAPGVVFDVGANRGAYALMCAEISSVHQVHAFEISPPTFKELQRNCDGVAKMVLNPFGLSDADREVEIYHAEGSSDRTSLHAIEHGYDSALLKAVVRTGDCYMETTGVHRVSFLKIDVEGADFSTLRGFERAFNERRIVAVQFEHGEPSVESRTFLRDIVRFLTTFDFTCFQLYPRSLEKVDNYGYRMEDFRGRNYIALSPSLTQSLKEIISPAYN